MLSNIDSERILRVVCCDKICRTVFYGSSSQTHLECFQCGQKRESSAFQDVREIYEQETESACDYFIRKMFFGNSVPKRGMEMVKVLGYSNYYCKLLSPLLTRYGMDKVTGCAKLLTEMNQGEIFDCSSLGDRAFLIDPEHISIEGFGRDVTGSMDYLADTLKLIISSNGGEERLIPIHADGDGHCLVHAVSRALVGRELFWHPLRCSLKRHFQTNLHKYKELFRDFVDNDEWQSIIEECDPDFQPPEGEFHGLRNLHIFGLANVLRRPIILLDSYECMQKCGDYSGVFLPGFVTPENCRGKDNSLNKPLCIAWSSFSHNHYIPLVGIQGKPLPVLPSALIPKVWGMPQNQIFTYIEFDDKNNCIVGGSRVLSDGYICRLVAAMEDLYYDQNGIHPSLVADYKLFLYPDNGLGAKPSVVLQKAKSAVQEDRLYRCLSCTALCEIRIERSWLIKGGVLYNMVFQSQRINPDELYEFPLHGIYCKHDMKKDALVPDMNLSGLKACTWCKSDRLRKLKSDGSVLNKQEDKVDAESTISTCSQTVTMDVDKPKSCDEKPKIFKINLEWNNKTVEESISWQDVQKIGRGGLTQYVSNMAKTIMAKNFPGETNARLQSYICQEIWKQIGKPIVLKESQISSVMKELQSTSTVSDKENEKPGLENAVAQENKQPEDIIPCDMDEPKTVIEPQYVKVVTSNGQQANLILNEKGVSYAQLQEWIRNQFKIPIAQQRIKLGFPPKELDALCEVLPLKHGDRLMVEIVQKEESKPPFFTTATERQNLITESIQKSFLSAFQCEILWNMAKQHPDQFKKNGSIYQQISEGNHLYDKMHTYLDGFPNKRFCYNSAADSIELCVKPYGHFRISSDIDKRIEKVQNGESVEGFSKCPLINNYKKPLRKAYEWPERGDASLKAIVTTRTAEETSSTPLLRRGPGFSILTSPESSDE